MAERLKQFNYDLLGLLPCAPQAVFNHEGQNSESVCSPNTRTDTINRIMRWVENNDKKSIFWLCGPVGWGKTTIAQTIARKCQDQGQLGASFFFRDDSNVKDSKKFFTTIAAQFAEKQPVLNRYIRDAIEEHPDIANEGLSEQWNQLIHEPLKKLFGPPRLPLVLVIDALDMCPEDSSVREIIQLLSSVHDLKTTPLLSFITCRPELVENHVSSMVMESKERDYELYDLETSAVDNNMQEFIGHSLDSTRKKFDLNAEWPGDDVTRKIISHSRGSFLWTATLCKFITSQYETNLDPISIMSTRFSDIFQYDSAAMTIEDNLNALYTFILNSLNIQGEAYQATTDFSSSTVTLIGALVTVSSPVSIDSMSALLGIEAKDIKRKLMGLSSVIQIPEDYTHPLMFFHTSFRDFLLDRSQYFSAHVGFNERATLMILGKGCLRVLERALKRDLLNSKSPDTRVLGVSNRLIDQCISKDVQYASQNWFLHLRKGGVQIRDHDEVHEFLRKHLLHWLETLSFLRQVKVGVQTIVELELIVSPIEAPNLFDFVKDAKRFIFCNETILETAPLQLYCSSLLFAPQESLIRKNFCHELPIWIRSVHGTRKNWSPLVKTLVGHSNYVCDIAFSNDGRMMATGSFDYSVRLWDFLSGTQIRAIKYASSEVAGISFSPDNNQIAIGYYDGSARLWEVATGTLIRHFSCEGIVDILRFDPDNRHLYALDEDGIKVWDLNTGDLHHVMKFPVTMYGRTEAISSTCQLLVSRPTISTVVIRRTIGGEEIRVLDGHTDWAGCVVFSPDSTMVTSACDKTVMLWDVSSGSMIAKLEGHQDQIRDVAISQDGLMVASLSADGTVMLWDAKTGSLMQELSKYFIDDVKIAFSPSGMLASGSSRGSVRLWSIHDKSPYDQSADCARTNVEGIVLSPNGELFTLKPWGNKFELLISESGATQGTFGRHLADILQVVFSPDSKLVASSSSDNMIKVWNIATIDLLHSIDFRLDGLGIIRFSPNGELIGASGGWNGGIGLWSVHSGKPCLVEAGPTTSSPVLFSSDSKSIVSGSHNGDITIWDTRTGRVVKQFTPFSNRERVEVDAMSQDGRYIGIMLYNSISIWDLHSGTETRKIENCHPQSARIISFSRNSKMIASASYEEEFKIWDLATGSLLYKVETGGRVYGIEFTGDDKYVNTSRGVWRVENLKKDPELEALRQPQLEILAKQCWLTQGGENILWLPSEYRATCAAVGKDFILLGHDTGSYTFISLAAKLSPFTAI